MSTVVANAVEGGRDPGKSDVYAPHEVVYVHDGDGWVMADIALSEEANDTPATCDPPTLEAELIEAWNGYVSASNAYNRDTSNEEAAAFSDVLVGSLEPEPNTVSQSWTEDVYARLEIAGTSPTRAHMSWCMDMSLDPDAKYVLEDGTSQPGWNRAWTGDWVPDDGEICTFLFITSSAKEIGGPLSSSVVTVWDYSWSLNGIDQDVSTPGLV